MAIELIKAFLQQATATGAKSTALTDLRWFIGIIASALLIAFKIKTEFWILILLSSILGVGCLIYLAAYVYFALRSPDALKSEKFTLSQMAIEKSIVGDNLSGLIDPEKQPIPLPPWITEKGDHESIHYCPKQRKCLTAQCHNRAYKIKGVGLLASL